MEVLADRGAVQNPGGRSIMGDWKQKDPKYPESKFAIQFREDHPELFTQLSDKGFLVPGKTIADDKYTYTVKEITSKKDSKKYTLVERVPVLGEKSQEQIAHDATNKEYQDGAKKGHEENLKAWDEQTKATLVLAQVLAKTNEYLEILAKSGIDAQLQKNKTLENIEKHLARIADATEAGLP
jgi:hypothetical protein